MGLPFPLLARLVGEDVHCELRLVWFVPTLSFLLLFGDSHLSHLLRSPRIILVFFFIVFRSFLSSLQLGTVCLARLHR